MSNTQYDETDQGSHTLDELIRQYRAAEEEKEKQQRTAITPEVSNFILQHYDRVLLFDRNEVAGESVLRLLRAEGYNVEWETDRDVAIEILESENFSTLVVSEGFSADGLLIRDTLKRRGIQVNLRVLKDFGTAILGHEESATMKETRRSFYCLLEFTIRMLESFHPPMVGHAQQVAKLARELAIRMELLPEFVDGITIAAYMHEISGLHERYKPFWEKSEDIFGGVDVKFPDWKVTDLTVKLHYPFPIKETLEHMQERFDGKGYPDGLKGEEIPIGARIIAPIDIYLNMVSGDIGPNMSKGEAMDQLIFDSGSAFDPVVIELLVAILKKDISDGEGTEYREKILMVDNFGDDDLVKIQLREEGYQIFWVPGINEALQTIESEQPFMIISDIDLKEGSGFQLLDIIRKRPDIKEIPFILMSSRSESSFISKGIRAGADDYLPRPCPTDLLFAKIARNISRHKGQSVGLTRQSGVTGTLKDMGILDLIQILAAGMKNAMISLTSGIYEARVALTDGRIVFAAMGDSEGEEAFYKIISWEDGEFTIHMNVTPPKENITIKNDMLLLEGFRRLDEQKR